MRALDLKPEPKTRLVAHSVPSSERVCPARYRRLEQFKTVREASSSGETARGPGGLEQFSKLFERPRAEVRPHEA